MPFKIVRNDITKMQVDAIVNTANPKPIYSYGTDTAVYKAAGEEELLKARREIGCLETGEVAITDGFRLLAKYIIHAVSPRYIDGKSGEEKKLRDCYQKSLLKAAEYQCKSIAFPLISTGSFGYPKEEAMRIALDEINAFLMNHDIMVYLVVFDSASTRLGFNLYPELEEYIDHNYVCDKEEKEYGNRYFSAVREPEASEPIEFSESLSEKASRIPSRVDRSAFAGAFPHPKKCSMPSSALLPKHYLESDDAYDDFLEEKHATLEERMSHMSDTFQEYLMYLIGNKKLTNSEVYHRAIVTKQLFSKIKLNPDYHPDKATAMRLCIGAKLNLDETKDLLARAGYALSPCDKRDIIFSFFIEHEIFDMIEIDIALEEHDLPCFIE